MKKIFVEPEIEILSFLCNDLMGSDYAQVGGGDGGVNEDILPGNPTP